MWSTILVVAVFAVLLTGATALWGVFLHGGARWAGIDGTTPGKTAAIAVIVAVGQLLLGGLVTWLSPPDALLAGLLSLVAGGLGIFLTCVLITAVYQARFASAVQAWLLTLVPTILITLFVLFVLRPLVYEAYVSPTNAMAPTLLGRHWEAPCPRCGQPSFCSPESARGFDSGPGVLMVCSRELRSCVVAAPDPAVLPADRFLVCKRLQPQRWDIVVFRYPEEPTVKYVMRLVGLPGEELQIRNGVLWIDGQQCAPPPTLTGIEYVTEFEPPLTAVWGSEGRPVKLAADEYFVLGDFSKRAKDSRLWYKGAPAHAPYAVPASYIEGVVTHIYWPPGRWRVFR
jgi:signal peptidase I